MIRRTTEQDFPMVCALLESEQLPTSDLEKGLPHFFVSVENNRIVGSVGLELYGKSALLRSMVVAPEFRSKGIASKLIDELTEYSRAKGVESLYLITNTAEHYFQKLQFKKISRDAVDKGVLSSKEFNGLCPASSAIMMKEL